MRIWYGLGRSVIPDWTPSMSKGFSGVAFRILQCCIKLVVKRKSSISAICLPIQFLEPEK